MKNVVFILLLFLLPSVGEAQNVRASRNLFGGYNYYEDGKLLSSSRKNLQGGYTYQGRVSGYSRQGLWGRNYNLNSRENNRYIPMFENNVRKTR